MKIQIKKIAGLLVSFAIIFAIFYNMDWGKTIEAFKNFNPYYLFLIIPVYYSSFIFRTIRWRILLGDNSCKKFELCSLIFIGNTLNSFLPARAGDIYRAHALGSQYDIKKVQVFASIVIERFLDGCVVFLFLIFTFMKFCKEAWMYKMTAAVGSIFVGGLLGLFLITRFNVFTRLLSFCTKHQNNIPHKIKNPIFLTLNFLDKHTSAFCEGLNIFDRPKQLVQTLFLTSILWLIEGFTVILVIKSYGINLSFSAAIFTLCLLVFSNLIPAASSMIGPYQFAYIKALSVFNIAKEQALAIAITNQTSIMLMVSLAGGLFLLHRNLKNTSKNKESSPDNTEQLSLENF